MAGFATQFFVISFIFVTFATDLISFKGFKHLFGKLFITNNIRMDNNTYNIYCDESCHLEHDNIKPMLLGCIWCPEDKKDAIFARLREIKIRNGIKPHCELKWNAVSPSKLSYYLDLVDYFFDNSDLHFRTLIVPDKVQLNHKAYKQSHDQFYYKMYFDLLKTIISPQNSYNIYIDIKDTQGQKKVERLRDVLCNNAYDFNKKLVSRIQQVRSHEVELVELADFFTGALGYVHRRLTTSKAKMTIIDKIRMKSGYSLTKSTLVKEEKFNIFIWKGKAIANG